MKPGPWHCEKLTHHEKRSVEEAPVFDLEKEADRIIWEQLPACRARSERRSANPALSRGHESVSPASSGKGDVPASEDASGGTRSRAARGYQ